MQFGRTTLSKFVIENTRASHGESAVAPRCLTSATFGISRTFDAPRDLVWTVHTKPEHLEKWWGPMGCKLTVERLEFRPGGIFHYCQEVFEGL